MFVADSSVWKGKPLLTFKFRGTRPCEEGGRIVEGGRSAVLCGRWSENVGKIVSVARGEGGADSSKVEKNQWTVLAPKG